MSTDTIKRNLFNGQLNFQKKKNRLSKHAYLQNGFSELTRGECALRISKWGI